MHEALTELLEELGTVVESLEASIPSDEPLGIVHNNYSSPCVTKRDLTEEVQSLVEFIEDHETENLGDAETRISDFMQRLRFISSQTIPNMWANASQTVPAFS